MVLMPGDIYFMATFCVLKPVSRRQNRRNTTAALDDIRRCLKRCFLVSGCSVERRHVLYAQSDSGWLTVTSCYQQLTENKTTNANRSPLVNQTETNNVNIRVVSHVTAATSVQPLSTCARFHLANIPVVMTQLHKIIIVQI